MKLLIVDDEYHIRMGLAEQVDWRSIGIDTVLTASDGEEAIDICKEHKPEIVITDIRMPGMDGLELSTIMKTLNTGVHIIILSGYSDFSYARSAIRIGVVDYFLKPVNIPELLECVRKACFAAKKMEEKLLLEEKYQYESSYELIINYLKQGSLELQEAFISTIMNLWNKTQEPFAELQLISPDAKLPQEVFDTWAAQICKYCSAFVGENASNSYIGTVDAYVVVIVEQPALSSGQLSGEAKEQASKTVPLQQCKVFHNDFGVITCSAGISSSAKIQKINLLFQEAQTALIHRMYRGPSSCIRYVSVKELGTNTLLHNFETAQLELLIVEGSQNAIKNRVMELFQQLKQARTTNSSTCRFLSLQIRDMFFRYLQEHYPAVSRAVFHDKSEFSVLPDYLYIDAYRDWVVNVLQTGLTTIIDESGYRYSVVITQALQFIHEHYRENLSVSDVAKHIQRSNNYFSTIFKKELHKGFIPYLQELRIKEACRMLEHTTDMQYEIAQKVGIDDYKYFSKIFRQLKGMSPSEYRDALKSENIL